MISDLATVNLTSVDRDQNCALDLQHGRAAAAAWELMKWRYRITEELMQVRLER